MLSNVSQDSTATYLRYGEIFNDNFFTNLLPSPTVNEF